MRQMSGKHMSVRAGDEHDDVACDPNAIQEDDIAGFSCVWRCGPYLPEFTHTPPEGAALSCHIPLNVFWKSHERNSESLFARLSIIRLICDEPQTLHRKRVVSNEVAPFFFAFPPQTAHPGLFTTPPPASRQLLLRKRMLELDCQA